MTGRAVSSAYWILPTIVFACVYTTKGTKDVITYVCFRFLNLDMRFICRVKFRVSRGFFNHSFATLYDLSFILLLMYNSIILIMTYLLIFEIFWKQMKSYYFYFLTKKKWIWTLLVLFLSAILNKCCSHFREIISIGNYHKQQPFRKDNMIDVYKMLYPLRFFF